jgi:hypothetical protein
MGVLTFYGGNPWEEQTPVMLTQLTNFLELLEGFGLALVWAERPKDLDFELETSFLYANRNRDIGSPLKVKHLRPIPGMGLITEVLPQLHEPLEPNVVLLLDGRDYTQEHRDHWVQLFHRVNEQRNTITNTLGGPMLLVGPTPLEVLFSHEAPDFWSIRRVSVWIPPRDLGPQG